MSARHGRIRPWLLWAMALLALALVTALYFQPRFVFELGVRLWSCF